MNNKRKIMACLLLILIALAGCRSKDENAVWLFSEETLESAEQEDTVLIFLTHSEEDGSYVDQMSYKFKTYLEEASGGAFHVEIYGDNTLGSVSESEYMLQAGIIQMRIGSGPSNTIMLLNYPILTGLTIPELMQAFQGDHLRMVIDEECLEKGVKILGILQPAYRVLCSNVPINKVEDLQNLRIRTAEFIISEVYWESLGAEPVNIGKTETFTALQQEIVNASADNSILQIYSRQYYKHQKYIIQTNHQIYLDPVYISKVFYESLSQQQQEILQEAVAKTVEYTKASMNERLAALQDEMEAAGIQFIDLSEEEKERMNEIAYHDMKSILYERFGEEQVNHVLQALQMD